VLYGHLFYPYFYLNDYLFYKLKKFILLREIQNSVKRGIFFLPWLKYIIPKASGYTGLKIACDSLHEYIREKIKDHEKKYIPGVPNDVMDSFIEQLRNTENPNSTFYGTLGG